jgi:predicted DNA-binding transcriptional regulator AlpA
MTVALADQAVAYYKVKDIATKLQISIRQVWRLNDAALMPPSIKLGRSVRWAKPTIDAWLANGCPPARKNR